MKEEILAAILLLSIALAGCTPRRVTRSEVPQPAKEIATAEPSATPLPSPERDRKPTAETPATLERSTATAEPTATLPPKVVNEAAPAGNPQQNGEEEIVLVYKSSGGIAGVNQEYTVYADGRVTANDGREWMADTEELSQLVQEIAALGFYEMAPVYKAKDLCCDLISFELSVNSGGESHTVSGVSGAPHIPNELRTILDLVQQFLNQPILQ